MPSATRINLRLSPWAVHRFHTEACLSRRARFGTASATPALSTVLRSGSLSRAVRNRQSRRLQSLPTLHACLSIAGFRKARLIELKRFNLDALVVPGRLDSPLRARRRKSQANGQSHLRAMANYLPRSSTRGACDQLRTACECFRVVDRAVDPLARKVRRSAVPGQHRSCITTHVEVARAI